MLIKSFFGESMNAAMQKATRELGEEALILNSRETPSEMKASGRFEVVATVSPAAVGNGFSSPLVVAAASQAQDSAPTHGTESANGVGAKSAAPTVKLSEQEIHVLAGLGGTGKTTCALKLAVQKGIWQGKRTAIMNFDANRAGRRDALDWYCHAAGIQSIDGLTWVREERQSPQSSSLLSDFEFVVIDTSGIYDTFELPPVWRDWLGEDRYCGHLVAPSWASARYFEAVQSAISLFHLHYLLPTYLDAALLSEDAASAAAKLDLGVRYLSAGAKAPNGLWDSSEAQLHALAEERRSSSTKHAGTGDQIASILSRSRQQLSKTGIARAASSEMVA